MGTVFRLTKETKLIVSGRKLRIVRFNGDQVQLEDIDNGSFSTIPYQEFLTRYDSGDIRPRQEDTAIVLSVNNPEGGKLPSHLDYFPPHIVAMLKIRRNFIERYLKEYGDCRSKNSLIEGIERLWPNDVEPPSASSVARWLKVYLSCGKDIRALAGRHFHKGNRDPRLAPKLKELCIQAIYEKYMIREKGSIKATLSLAISLVKGDNQTLPLSKRLKLPTRSTIRGLIESIPAIERDTARNGKEWVRRHYWSAVNSIVTSHPLERAEVDHTLLDIMIVDEITGLCIGRPWLTMIMDVHTRCILGFSISFDPPSQMTVARALKHALLPKIDLHTKYPNVKGQLTMFGRMIELVMDNGLDFHSHGVESACFHLGINIAYCARKTPQWKPHIERLLGTLNRDLFDGVKGRTFSGISEKGDYDPAKTASITLDALREAVMIWVVDMYHETVHSSLGITPREAWERGIDPSEIPMISDPELLDAIVGIPDRPALSHNGIRILGLRYNSDELGFLRTRYMNLKKIDIKYNPEDLSSIQVFDPQGGVLCVPAVPSLKDYVTGLSLYMHKCYQAYAKEFLESKNDPESLAFARYKVDNILAESAIKSAKARLKLARMKSTGTTDQSKPATPAPLSPKPSTNPEIETSGGLLDGQTRELPRFKTTVTKRI